MCVCVCVIDSVVFDTYVVLTGEVCVCVGGGVTSQHVFTETAAGVREDTLDESEQEDEFL